MQKMEMIYKSFAIGFAFVCMIWAWTIINWTWLRPKKLERYLRKQGLKGSPYKFLFGDLKENSLMTKQARSNPINLSDDIVPRLLPFMEKSLAVHGNNSFTWFGPKPRITIMDPVLIKEVMVKNLNYEKPTKVNPLSRLLTYGLASLEGDQWVKHRKIIIPAFHTEKIKLMVPAFCLSSHEIVSKWEKIVANKGGSCELDVWPYLETLTSDAISRTAFGSNYEEGRIIFQLQKELAEHVIQATQSLYFPGLRFFPTKGIKRMKTIDKEVNASLHDIIDRRLKTIQAGETSDDLLDLMLQSNLTEIQQNGNNKKVGMSIDEVIGECKLFYVAGQETSSGLLVWTLILLSMHQDWQQRAREEVFQVFGDNKPNFDGLNHLKIVTMILHEVLRLYPPITALNRQVPEDIKLGNISVPAGALLYLPTLIIHRSKELWGEDANEFKPERFSEGVFKATKGQVSYFPFGWGPRICIGQQFAMIEVKIAVSMILQRFSLELSPSYTHAPMTVVNIKPQYGAHLILHRL